MRGRTDGRRGTARSAAGDATPGSTRGATRGAAALLGALLLLLAGCGPRGEPQVTVADLDWACGTTRCTATFALAAGDDAETVLVRVRAYAGASVADREIVGEQRERVSLRAGATRRLTVTVPTERPADRLRVIVEPDRD